MTNFNLGISTPLSIRHLTRRAGDDALFDTPPHKVWCQRVHAKCCRYNPVLTMNATLAAPGTDAWRPGQAGSGLAIAAVDAILALRRAVLPNRRTVGALASRFAYAASLERQDRDVDSSAGI